MNFGLLAAIFPHRQFSTAAAGEENRASWVLKPDESIQVSIRFTVSGARGINLIRIFTGVLLCIYWVLLQRLLHFVLVDKMVHSFSVFKMFHSSGHGVRLKSRQ